MLTARGVWKSSILRCSSSRVSSSARFLHRRHSHRVTRRHSAVRLQQARRRAPGRFLEDELAKGGPKVLRVDAGARRNVALHEPHELVVDLEAALVDHYGHEADGHAARAHPLAGPRSVSVSAADAAGGDDIRPRERGGGVSRTHGCRSRRTPRRYSKGSRPPDSHACSPRP